MKPPLTKEYVIAYLEEAKEILNPIHFNISTDFRLLDERDKNYNFILQNNYYYEQVPDVLRKLTVNDYSDYIIDYNDDGSSPYLMVFGTDINNKEIYIKFKIIYSFRNKILCISFHEAEYKMNYPFREEAETI